MKSLQQNKTRKMLEKMLWLAEIPVGKLSYMLFIFDWELSCNLSILALYLCYTDTTWITQALDALAVVRPVLKSLQFCICKP